MQPAFEMHSPYFRQLLSNGPILAGHSPGLTGALWKWKQQQEVTKHTLKNEHPAGEPSTSPQISTRILGEFQGTIHVEISSLFPCGNLGEMKGIFYVDISAAFPCGIPGDISTLKLPLCFPQNFKMQYNDIGRVPVVGNIPVIILCHSLVNYNVYRFEETLLSFQPQFGNSPEFPHGILFHLSPKIPQNLRDFAHWAGWNEI